MWNRRDCSILTLAALSTFALTLGLFWAAPAIAGDGKKSATTTVKTPTLALGTIHVTAARSSDKSRTILLSATNTSDKPATAHFRAAAMVVGTSSPGSRSPQPATVAWSQGFTANLKPGESTQITVPLPPAAYPAVNAKTRAGTSFLTLSTDDAKESIQALTLHS